MKRFFQLLILLSLFASSALAQNRAFKDIPYLSKEVIVNDSLQRLSLVVPNEAQNPPLLIWIGGGAWSYGDYNQELDLAQQFASSGIAVASVGHRLSPAIWRDPSLNTGIKHPSHVKDIAAAVKWLFNNFEEYGYDRNKIFIGGFSSGGHLAALIDLDRRYLEVQGLPANIFKGIIPISGAYDIANYHQVFKNGSQPELAQLHVEAVFGETHEAFTDASPMTYLKNLSTPMLIMSDGTVDRYTRHFEEAIKKTSFKAYEVIYASELAHAELWRDLSFSAKSDYRQAIIDFISKY